VPDLDTSLHTDMLLDFKRQNSLPRRLYRSIRRELKRSNIYGIGWGDPEVDTPLRFIRNHWLLPYVADDQIAVEIGPGGGRWTQYLLGFKKVFAVDYYPELLEQLRKSFHKPNLVLVQNSGTDFPGIPLHGVDFVFSFGTFVHLEPELIEDYLRNIREILKPGGNVVIHYSDKNKIMARKNSTFVETTPDIMRSMVREAGFEIAEEDLTTLWHSSLIRITI
jgi:SAM-dependent methyltransferase